MTPTRVVAELQTGGMVLREFDQRPELRIPWHRHRNGIVSFTLRGSARESFSRRTYDLDASCILIKPPEEGHTHEYLRGGSRVFTIEIPPERLDIVARLNRVSIIKSAHMQNLFLRLRSEMRYRDAGSQLIVEGLVLEILGGLLRQADSTCDKAAAHRMAEFLEDSFREKVSITELAAIAGTSVVRATEAFRKAYGCSVGEYQRDVRFRRALELLEANNRSLTAIAQECGFFDQSHFTREIKTRTGMTPRDWQQRTRNGEKYKTS